MAMAKITGQGLCAMAVLVVFLWGCLLLERSTVEKARYEQYRALEEIRSLRMMRRAEPASVPVQRVAPGRRAPTVS
jgi:hypothetical protein